MYTSIMKCPHCNEPMVAIVYGFPSMEMIERAKRDEIVLGGMPKPFDFKPTHYCHGCQEQYPESEPEFDSHNHIPMFSHGAE